MRKKDKQEEWVDMRLGKSLKLFIIPRLLMKKINIRRGNYMEISIEFGAICLRRFNFEQDIMSRPHIGVVRKIDHEGRISIPAEYRKVLKIDKEDLLDVFLQGNVIKIRKRREEIEEG